MLLGTPSLLLSWCSVNKSRFYLFAKLSIIFCTHIGWKSHTLISHTLKSHTLRHHQIKINHKADIYECLQITSSFLLRMRELMTCSHLYHRHVNLRKMCHSKHCLTHLHWYLYVFIYLSQVIVKGTKQSLVLLLGYMSQHNSVLLLAQITNWSISEEEN